MVSAKSDVTTQENISSFLNYCNRDDAKERPCSGKLLGGIGWVSLAAPYPLLCCYWKYQQSKPSVILQNL